MLAYLKVNRLLTKTIGFTVLVTAQFVIMSGACTASHPVGEGFANHASALLDSTFHYYQTERTGLFNENYPRQEGEKVTYLASDDTITRDKVAYLWPTSGLFSGVNALLRATGDAKYQEILHNVILPGLAYYYDATRQPACYQSYLAEAGESDRFYDDNIWLGIDFLESYSLTGEARYLKAAEEIRHFLESGRDSLLNDGIYWCEQKKLSKNTCSNAPASVLALKLYQTTGNGIYLKAGQELYHWTKDHLEDIEDGLYWDNIALSGEISRAKYAYNSGQMLQASTLLYQITHEPHYLKSAQRLAQACSDYFFEKKNKAGKEVRVLKNGNVWFVAVMLRGFEELYRADGNRSYLDDFIASLDKLWQQSRDANGLFEDDRLDADAPAGDKKHKWLLTQAAFVEMYARLATVE